METLKPFAAITEPGPRQTGFVRFDPNIGQMRPQTIDDFYRASESIQLHAGVPMPIRSHFETARHLIIYSWFFYPFNVTAQLAAYTTVEFALRSKFQDRKTPFKALLQKAVDAALITDKGFSIPRRKAENIREHNKGLPPEHHIPEPSLMSDYSAALTRSMPYLRNQLAHGSSMLHHYGPSTVRICAELINQLFPSPATSAS